MGAAASSRIRIFRGWLPRQVCLLPARGGEKPIEGYARRSSWDAFSGRGFDSHHLHQVSFLPDSSFSIRDESHRPCQVAGIASPDLFDIATLFGDIPLDLRPVIE